MKEKLKNKKVVYTIIGIVALILVTIAVTYAYWLVTRTQTNNNIISSGCLDISLSNEENDITLLDQFPLSDEDGMKLTPYTFTITNNCNTSVDYQVNIEAIGDESTALSSESLKIALDDNISILSDNYNDVMTIENAYASYRLIDGTLGSKDTEYSIANYELRIWIDKDADISEMNKTFRSKISVIVGQGINNSLKEGTLAYDLVSSYGDPKNVSKLDKLVYTTETNWINSNAAISYGTEMYWGTDYEYDEITSKYTLTGDVVLATHDECNAGTKNCGEYFVGTGTGEYNIYASGKLSDVTLMKREYELDTDNFIEMQWWPVQYKSFDINTSENIATSGLYKTLDDLGTSYFLKGDVIDNYVKFGKWQKSYGGYYGGSLSYGPFETLEDCQAESENGAPWEASQCYEEIIIAKNSDILWRIVRINGDGSIRLILDDSYSGGFNDISFNNESLTSEQYVSYTYNNGEKEINSTIKDVVDDFYATNLQANYSKYLADGIFCNDRSAGVVDGTYGFNNRYNDNRMYPTLICSRQVDRYTVNNSKGNNLLTYPIGLLSADEYMFSSNSIGDIINSNSFEGFLADGYYWTMTPINSKTIYKTEESGNYYDVVRPVINLKADIKFTGDGSYETPYEIVTE